MRATRRVLLLGVLGLVLLSLGACAAVSRATSPPMPAGTAAPEVAARAVSPRSAPAMPAQAPAPPAGAWAAFAPGTPTVLEAGSRYADAMAR